MKHHDIVDHIETLAVHAGRRPDPATGAVAPSPCLSTTFERDPDGEYPRGYNYVRDGNPTRDALESALAALEGGEGAVSTSSGSAATLALFHAAARRGPIVASHEAYHGTLRQLRDIVPGWGAEVRFVDTTDSSAVAGALGEDAALLFVETPSNPTLRITEIGVMAELAAATGARLAVDNTFATPVLQRPLAHGADFVVHSTTKYIGGHSDVMGGAVVAASTDVWFDDIDTFRKAGGAAPSPFDSWLLLRSLPTLPARVRLQSSNAAHLAREIADLEAVERVFYPGLPGDPGHRLAARQMDGFGAMLSVLVRGGREGALAVTGRCRLFTRATSLGGVESLIEHRASIEGPGTQTPEGLLRISVGLEHVDDLVDDLTQALRPA